MTHRILKISRRLILCCSVLLAQQALAQELVHASPDITLGLAGGAVVADEETALDNRLGIILRESLGPLPLATDVIALGAAANGDRLMAFDTAVSLAGGAVAAAGDVVRYDGAVYSIEFDASASGVPSGLLTDSVALAPGGLRLSFDTTVALPGVVVAADEDLVRFAGGVYTMVLDGSAVGIETSLDIDAAEDLGGGAFLVSFDTTGVLSGITFADEDPMRWDGAVWSLEYDASVADSAWGAADLDAVMVPEPGVGALLAPTYLRFG